MWDRRPIALLISLAALALAAGPALGGQAPYVATTGEDCSIPEFYLSDKHEQFSWGIAPTFELPEPFGFSRGITPAAEQCNVDFPSSGTNLNWHLPNRNAGTYTWRIQLPGKPQGNLQIVFQCGLLKPNTEIFGVLLCGGETGERVDTFCERDPLFGQPGLNPVNPSWMPTLTARAVTSDGSLIPFHLTAYRNPGNYSLTGGTSMTNGQSLQVLDGSFGARIQLKSCQDKAVVVKFPVTGQVNALGETEFDLESLDLIDVQLAFPRGHSMDVYCHEQSVTVRGLMDPQTVTGSRTPGHCYTTTSTTSTSTTTTTTTTTTTSTTTTTTSSTTTTTQQPCPCFTAADLAPVGQQSFCIALNAWSGFYTEYYAWPEFNARIWNDFCWFQDLGSNQMTQLPLTPPQVLACRALITAAATNAGVTCQVY